MSKLKIYFDSDVLIASSVSTNNHSAGQVLLVLSEITLVDAITSEFAITECERNISKKFTNPNALDSFRNIVDLSLDVVAAPTQKEVNAHSADAHWKDVPHIASAIGHDCTHLITYNTCDFHPQSRSIKVVKPGKLVMSARLQLSGL